MDDYMPNSHRFKAEQAAKNKPQERRAQKVVQGSAKKKKTEETGFKKFRNEVQENLTTVKGHLETIDGYIQTIVGISDTIMGCISLILYGKGGSSGWRSTNADRVSWRDYSAASRDNGGRRYARYDFDDVTYKTRQDAVNVLESLNDMLEAYGVVSVADMYDLAGVTSNYTDNKYGWNSLRNIDIVRVRDGYILKLPKAQPIN